MLSLKKFRPAEALSEETLAYSAEVCLNGVVVGRSHNTGTGGCDMVHIDREHRDAFHAAARALVEADAATRAEAAPESAEVIEEFALGILVDRAMAAREEARLARWEQREAGKLAGRGFPVSVVAEIGEERRIVGAKQADPATLAKVAAHFGVPAESLRVVIPPKAAPKAVLPVRR